ncbi:NACHT, LRR and PYD domains-containing protein 14 isoform X4 [Coregonus clupeaformis]|uniref:NACHT, LRR and PYD domains-containing protein 14 isoform X4 n=1 Tax=Coregonus clupeaformis TaxID=59861 RepID=UPI001E1C872C|nr:NACHT, LRR and PYD domains-containing protein 14 isoform X4 [Coregonus clupeaformis]
MSLSGENEGGSTPSSICEETEERDTAARMSFSGSEGAMSPKNSLPAEQDTGSELKRFKTDRPVSPVPSCVSMKSDRSMRPPIDLREGDFSIEQRFKTDRPVSPVPSCVSMKSDKSKGLNIYFRDGEVSTGQSSISEKNDQSMDHQPRVLTDDKVLNECKLTKKSCEAIASVLKSNSCCLRLLDMSGNKLQDSGVKLLSAGLGYPHCKLEKFKLADCNITEEGCASLLSALRSNPSHLKELDLRGNTPGDSGVKLLSSVREDPLYTLETLRLND